MVNNVSESSGNCARTNIECQLQRSWTLGVQALRHHGDRAQDQRLGETEFENTDKNEKEIHRQGSGDARQVYFETRCQDRDAHVADEFRNIVTVLVNAAIHQRRHSRQHDQGDKHPGAQGQSSPRA